MRLSSLKRLLAAALLLLSACSAPAQKQNPASIQQLMDRTVDPAADALWGAVGDIETAKGIEHKAPATPQEWDKLEAQARQLVDGAAQLESPRPVGGDGHGALADATTPGIRTAAQIESDIKADPKRFAAAAERLRLAGLQAQSAIQKRDSAALIEAGAAMDAACEACHSAYWYPRTPALPLPPTH
ncbi:MAG: hypothetical protein AB1429_15730 [Pseudomonadota bacterium]|jgi:cytochrome c556